MSKNIFEHAELLDQAEPKYIKEARRAETTARLGKVIGEITTKGVQILLREGDYQRTWAQRTSEEHRAIYREISDLVISIEAILTKREEETPLKMTCRELALLQLSQRLLGILASEIFDGAPEVCTFD